MLKKAHVKRGHLPSKLIMKRLMEKDDQILSETLVCFLFGWVSCNWRLVSLFRVVSFYEPHGPLCFMLLLLCVLSVCFFHLVIIYNK